MMALRFKFSMLLLCCIFAAAALVPEATTEDFTDGDAFMEVEQPAALKYSYRLRQARFGGSFPREQKGLRMVVAEPLECCSPLYNAAAARGAVVLADRGQCSFVSKAVAAEAAGAAAIVVTEMALAEPSHRPIEMVLDETHRRPSIPSYFMLGSHGDAFRAAMGDGHAIVNLPINL